MDGTDQVDRTHSAEALWLPRPRRVEPISGHWLPTRRPQLRLDGDHPAAVERLEEALVPAEVELAVSRGPETPGGEAAELRWRLAPEGEIPAQGYRLDIGPSGISLQAADAAGLYYGALTLSQWIEAHRVPGTDPLAIPCVRVVDSPDLAVRGVLLDISRDRVPTVETVRRLVTKLAGWKINQLQLYMEHTFAYRGHEEVWQGADPWTPDEIRDLDAHCRRHHVELVPNQNSFGHFHRWLSHPRYRPLAEVPEGVEHPFGDTREPFSLCAVDPASLELLEDLYDQLLPNFTSRLLNVGLDETFDLGQGGSAQACQERGRQEVYLEYLVEVHRRVTDRGRRMQFWGDIILERPDLLDQVPEDAIALAWGYEADHPFDQEARRLAASGLDFYLCPGTSSWNSLGGRVPNAVANIAAAARAAKDHGARGLLLCDWGDFGHLQPLPMSYPGFLVGAAWAWNAEGTGPTERELPALLAYQALPGSDATILARALVELGSIYRLPGGTPKNGSALFFLLLFGETPLDSPRFRGLDEVALEATAKTLDDVLRSLGPLASDPEAETGLVSAELRWVATTLRFACDLGLARLRENLGDQRGDLARRLAALLESLEPLWLARSRPGGLEDARDRVRRSLQGLLKPETRKSRDPPARES